MSIQDQEDFEIGRAFSECLLRDLPEEILDIHVHFAGVRQVDTRLRHAIQSEPDVIAAGPSIEPFLQYGITPVKILLATHSVANAIRQHYMDNRIPRSAELLIDWKGDLPEIRDAIRREFLKTAIRLAIESPDDKASRLLDWLLAASAAKPLIFDGIRVRSQGQRRHVIPLGYYPRLEACWGSSDNTARDTP